MRHVLVAAAMLAALFALDGCPAPSASCTINADCSDGQVCHQGACVAGEGEGEGAGGEGEGAEACAPGCIDGATQRICSATGQAVPLSCPDGQACLFATGQCVPANGANNNNFAGCNCGDSGAGSWIVVLGAGALFAVSPSRRRRQSGRQR